MTRSATVAELADRCEKATGPDREFDLRIWLALNDKQVMTDGGGHGKRPVQYTSAREIWDDSWPYWHDAGQVRDACLHLDVPLLTGSLDAAMTLVGPLFYWIMAKGRTRRPEPLYAIQILDAETNAVVAQSESNLLEGCICTASLRAIAANSSSSGEG